MAYVIESSGMIKIAANDTQKGDMNFSTSTSYNITDSEFNSLKKDKAYVTISDGSATVTAKPSSEYSTAADLKNHHENMMQHLEAFLENNPSTKDVYSNAQTYYNTLRSFDYSTVTFPLQKSWEEYCEDNSITYLHHLQIP